MMIGIGTVLCNTGGMHLQSFTRKRVSPQSAEELVLPLFLLYNEVLTSYSSTTLTHALLHATPVPGSPPRWHTSSVVTLTIGPGTWDYTPTRCTHLCWPLSTMQCGRLLPDSLDMPGSLVLWVQVVEQSLTRSGALWSNGDVIDALCHSLASMAAGLVKSTIGLLSLLRAVSALSPVICGGLWTCPHCQECGVKEQITHCCSGYPVCHVLLPTVNWKLTLVRSAVYDWCL